MDNINTLVLNLLKYPIGSAHYKKARAAIVEHYAEKETAKGKDPEYVLCIRQEDYELICDSASKKLGDGTNILTSIPENYLQWIWRADAEYNLEFYQIVVGVGLVTKKSREMVILHNLAGDMAGSDTIIQGHCSFDHSPNYLNIEPFDRLRHNSVIAELDEEIRIKDYSATKLLKQFPDYSFCNVMPYRDGYSLDIDSFHIGFIENYEIDDDILKSAVSNEPTINSLSLVPVMDILKNADKYDNWVVTSAKNIYNNNFIINLK